MRRSILGLLICTLVLGLIGIDFGHDAQARSLDKKVVKHASAKKAAAGKSAKKHKSASVKKTHKAVAVNRHKAKHTLAKNTKHSKKDRLARHSHGKGHHQKHLALKGFHELESIPQPPPQVSDLWLAKDNPETYRQMSRENEVKGQPSLTRRILESAYSYLGKPYRYGGTTPHGFDCSGFVRYVFGENGIKLGRSSREQATDGVSVPMSDLKPGDLIFFNMHRRNRYLIDHVGLYVGNGQFIHAASSHSREIKMESLESEHYLPKVVETRRVLEEAEN